MRRRQFIALLGAAAATGLSGRGVAQTPGRMRRIAVVGNTDGTDADTRARVAGLRSGLAALGWSEGRNIDIAFHWGAGDGQRLGDHARGVAQSGTDVVVAYGTPATAALKAATSDIPIVFALIMDPVGDGFVASLSRPGGNITGFSAFDAEIGGKWVELLKELAPGLRRAALVYNPRTFPTAGSPIIQDHFKAAAQTLRVEAASVPVENPADLQRALTAYAAQPGGGVVATPDGFLFVNSALLVRALNELRLPAVYPFRHFAAIGGLMSYGVDTADLSVRAASYVDRILKGEKPADLPVQAPTKFSLTVNARTARTLALQVPETLLARADEVIE